MPTGGRNARKPPTFKFKNVGPVADADLELGDLTIIAGRNNTGKTYLVYTLYGFLQMWHTWPDAAAPYAGHGPPAPAERGRRRVFDDLVEQTARRGRATVSADRDTLASERKAVLRALTRAFSRESLAAVFSSPPDAFHEASLGVELDWTPPDQLPEVEIGMARGETLAMRHDGAAISVDGMELERRQPRPPDEVAAYVSSLYLRLLFPDLPLSPFVLCAERFGISLFYKELDFTKNQLVDLLQKLGDRKEDARYLPYVLIDQTVSRYALPIKHNIDYTRGIADLRRQRSEIYDDKLFEGVKALMNGYYKATSDNIEFKSAARGRGRFSIPLHLASSSARGLSDLYFFLRHVARRNHLLIIDEPEGHLDTANQIRLARLLARLVRTGLRVVLTTHSDYLVKELNNLVMLDGPLDDREAVAERLGYEADDRIAPDRIRAYVTEKHGLTPCTVDRYGIDMPIFDTTIDSINAVANELSSRLSESAGGALATLPGA